jgi:hypothetical protein
MRLSRVSVFARDVRALARFTADAFGLEAVGAPTAGWAELEAGGCRIAFHSGGAAGRKPVKAPKLVFGSADVSAARDALVRRGVRMGKMRSFDGIELCDGRDPEGNLFQVSSRP